MKKLGFIVLWLFSIVGCKKTEVDKSNPSCVESKIKDFNTPTICTDAKVDEYTFQGKTVYAIDPGTCGADMAKEIIDSDCKSLGFLGGITGNTKINGVEFSTSTFVKTIWKK